MRINNCDTAEKQDLSLSIDWYIYNSTVISVTSFWCFSITEKREEVLLTVSSQEYLDDTWKLIISSPTMIYDTP